MTDESKGRELDALIVRNIADLEASLERAKGHIDRSLNREAWSVLKETLGEQDWYFEDNGQPGDRWFAPRDWVSADSNGDEDADPWFRLAPLDRKDVYETWLAHYVAPTNDRQKFSILWCWHQFYAADYKAAAADACEELEAIRALGFHQDGRELLLPIEFETEELATAFATGDFKLALEPVADAAEQLLKGTQHFSTFRSRLLKAKR